MEDDKKLNKGNRFIPFLKPFPHSLMKRAWEQIVFKHPDHHAES